MEAGSEPTVPDVSQPEEAAAPSSAERADDTRSGHPTSGPRVGEEERAEALDAMPAANATTADMVDTDTVDSSDDAAQVEGA